VTAARNGKAFSITTGRPVSTAACGNAANSSTAPREKPAPCPFTPSWWRSSAPTSRNLAQDPAGASSACRGGIVTDRAYLAVFHKAPAAAFTKGESASLLDRRPYDLRHAAVSTWLAWLNAGVAPAQVAEWAGHTVDVLLRVYAKCIAGQQEEAKRRILEATQPDQDQPDASRPLAEDLIWATCQP